MSSIGEEWAGARSAALGALLALVALTGCAQRGPINAMGAEEGTAAGRRNAAVLITPALADAVLVERSGARLSATGTFEVSFVVQNASNEPRQVESRVHFLDETDAEAEPPSAWQRTHLQPNSFATIVEQSTSRKPIVHYFIELR